MSTELAAPSVTYEIWEEQVNSLGFTRAVRRHSGERGYSNPQGAQRIADDYNEEQTRYAALTATPKRFFVVKATTTFEEVTE